MDAIKILFWFSAVFILYAYPGYPAVVWLISLFKSQRRRPPTSSGFPTVSLLISAYNEKAVIEEKIKNSLSLTYPKELLEIVVISDGSDDGTNEIVERYSSQGVRLKYFEGRIGKTACLNQVVPASRGDIIVFSDANSIYDSEALRNLVVPFHDETVGFVTGYTRYSDQRDSGTSSSLGLYAAMEKFTKKAESRMGSCVGADGAIFAVRKSLYKPLQKTDINDFVIPLTIVRQGFRGVLAENAFCVEQAAGNSRDEFRRQVRITNRTLRALFNNPDLLNPLAHALFAFELFSHKAAKFLAPFFIILFVFCAIVLASSGTGYLLLLLALCACPLFALGSGNERRRTALSRFNALCITFLATNAAILAGWFHFMRGKTFVAWSPVKR